jgi:hypothetical protein
MIPLNPGTDADDPRRCLECGKPVVRRRITALYCSGKCRERHNARKRQQTRYHAEEVMPAAGLTETRVQEANDANSARSTDCTPRNPP